MDIPEFPNRITVELTNVCNYTCAMCPSRLRSDVPQGFMETELFQKIVDQASAHLPVALVPFFRGESLLHPNLVRFIDYAKARGLGPVQLATNGSLLDPALARGLLDTGLDFISFSVDTMRPEEYAVMRRGGRLDLVVRNIERFLNLRAQNGYTTEVQVSATRTGLNNQSIDELIAFWRPRVDRVRIYWEHSADGHTGSLHCPEIPEDMPRQPCLKVFNDLVICFDGSLAACNHDWFRETPLGDVRTASIQDAWRGGPYQDLRRQHLAPKRLSDPTCRHCDHWKVSYLDKPYIGELYTARTRETSVKGPPPAGSSNPGPGDPKSASRREASAV